MDKKELAAAKWIEKNYNLKSLKGQRIDISNFPEYKKWEGQDVYIEIGPTGSIKDIRQISQAELREEKEAEIKKARELEDKKMFNEVVRADQKNVLKARIERQRADKELKESPEKQSEEFAEVKQELQNAYVDLITAKKDIVDERGFTTNAPYNPDSLITTQPKFYKEYNKVINAEKKLNKVTKKLSRLRGDSVYIDSLNLVRNILGKDANFSAQLPKNPQSNLEESKIKMGEAVNQMNPKFENLRNTNQPLENTSGQKLPSVLQQKPKKSTQDASKNQKLSEEELKRILGS